MTSMLQRKRSFFSQDSGSVGSNSSSDHLPMLVESRHCESPPPTISSNPYAMDFSALDRIAPGRATSMSIVRQRSGNSLSPTSKDRPRKSISMFFSSTSSSSSSPSSYQSDSSVDYSMPHYHQHSNPYGMLNPGPDSRREPSVRYKIRAAFQDLVCTDTAGRIVNVCERCHCKGRPICHCIVFPPRLNQQWRHDLWITYGPDRTVGLHQLDSRKTSRASGIHGRTDSAPDLM